ncbi:MAG: hypothetical protein AB8F78_08075 [Saprospiraceae bacterium]
MKQALLILFALCIASSACEEQKEKPLNAATRKLVSQGYADTVRILTPIVDSLCELNQEKLVAELTDSLYNVRITDLNRQRKRFQQ